MNLKKIVGAVSALAILGSTVVAFANTTKYVGPTTSSEIRLSTILGKDAFGDDETVAQVAAKADMATVGSYTGWSYHHAMQDVATSSNINADRQSQLKVNSSGLLLIGVNGNQTGTSGAYIAYKPVIGTEEVFYSFDVTVTDKGEWALGAGNRAVKVGNTYASGLESGNFYVDLITDRDSSAANTAQDTKTHKVYMTFKPSNNYATISVDGELKKKDNLTAASTGIFIQAPYDGNRNADIQISNFRYGYVNNNTDAKYTTASYDIPQYKTADGYDKDATAAILQITAYETLDGFTVTYNGKTLSTETNINDGSTVSIGVIVPGLYDRPYFNTDNRFTIGKKPVVSVE